MVTEEEEEEEEKKPYFLKWLKSASIVSRLCVGKDFTRSRI